MKGRPMSFIYLDYNATTPVAPEVTAAMLPYLSEHFGNPSSPHLYGARAKQAVEAARAQVSALLDCQPQEIIFTSGGTESNNTAIQGIAMAYRDRGTHIITSAVEHPAVIEVCRWLETQGFRLTVLPVDSTGRVNPDDLARAITPDTILVTVMHANNEVGTLQPIAELTEIAHRHGAWVHTDAAQSIGKIPVRVSELGVDLLSVAGHKLYAPKGIGALYIRKGVHLQKLMFGASHERNLRPGTENVPSIVGLGQACHIAGHDLAHHTVHLQAMRDRLQKGLLKGQGENEMRVNGHPHHRLPNTLSVSFRGIRANDLLEEIGMHVAASAGAACHADGVSVSTVLQAMGVPLEWAMGTVRFSVGRATTPVEIDQATAIVIEAVCQLRSTG